MMLVLIGSRNQLNDWVRFYPEEHPSSRRPRETLLRGMQQTVVPRGDEDVCEETLPLQRDPDKLRSSDRSRTRSLRLRDFVVFSSSMFHFLLSGEKRMKLIMEAANLNKTGYIA